MRLVGVIDLIIHIPSALAAITFALFSAIFMFSSGIAQFTGQAPFILEPYIVGLLYIVMLGGGGIAVFWIIKRDYGF